MFVDDSAQRHWNCEEPVKRTGRLDGDGALNVLLVWASNRYALLKKTTDPTLKAYTEFIAVLYVCVCVQHNLLDSKSTP